MSGKALGVAWDQMARHPEMGTSARLMYVAMADLANDLNGNEIWAAVGTLAKRCGMARSTATRAIAELTSLGVLAVVQERPGSPTRYRLLVEGCSNLSQGVTQSESGGDSICGTSLKRTSTDLQNPPVVPPRGDESAFGEFWDAYPRKEAKAAAARAWLKASRRAAPATIIDGALRYRADPNRDPAFTCHASTWLNQDRWSDPPLPARRRSTADVLHEDDPAQQHAVMRLLGLEATR